MKIERILIVGLGSIGRRHLAIIKELYPLIEIAVLRHNDLNKDANENVGVKICTSSIDEVMLFKPQAAIIANPASKHLVIATKLANQGVHILIEKPIADSSVGVSQLIDLCSKNKLVLMTGYNLRFLPSLIDFRNLINTNKVGNIFSIHAEVGQHLSDWRSDVDYKKTVSAKKELGGGILLELSHEIDYLYWIFGPIKWVKSHVEKVSNLDIDVEDCANVILGFEGSLGHKNTASLSMDCFRHDPVRKCIVIGESGTLKWNGISGEVKYYSKTGNGWEVLFSLKPNRDFTYIEEIKHFFFCIEEGKTSIVTGEDGLNAVHGVEAINRSNINGGIVYL